MTLASSFTLRELNQYDVLRDGNTPGMIETATAGFCKFFDAIPFVSHTAVFERLESGEDTSNDINIAVFLHNPPVLQRKPVPFWDPCGTGEWMIHADYDIHALFGSQFIENLVDYSGELPLLFNPNLFLIFFDELVITNPEYRRLELKNWKSRKWINHVFKTLRIFDPATLIFKSDERWQKSIFSKREHYWVLQRELLTPSSRKPQYGGVIKYLSKTAHTSGHNVSVNPWEKVGLVSLQSARSQGFELCKDCIGD